MTRAGETASHDHATSRRVGWIVLAALAGACAAAAIVARTRDARVRERWHGEAAQPVDASAMAS
jgi:hypothetical protein